MQRSYKYVLVKPVGVIKQRYKGIFVQLAPYADQSDGCCYPSAFEFGAVFLIHVSYHIATLPMQSIMCLIQLCASTLAYVCVLDYGVMGHSDGDGTARGCLAVHNIEHVYTGSILSTKEYT